MEWADIILPFQFGFMQKAFLIGIIVAVPTALLSCFLVMKGWALMGDAVSHAILPGIVLAYIFGFPLLIRGISGRHVMCVDDRFPDDK